MASEKLAVSVNQNAEIDPLEKLAEAAIAAERGFERQQRRMTVLFADLCDSTSYKLNRGDIEGLLKTYRHNQIVGTAVNQFEGKIVKYIGDEVMATFEGDNGPENALNAAVEIQGVINRVNDRVSGAPDEKIHSKIGINSGEVILVTFPGHDEADPQGRVVDAAARIIGLCHPDQILCSESVVLGFDAKFSNRNKRIGRGARTQ